MRYHGIPAAHGVLCISEWVVLRCGLWEPYVTAIAVQVAGSKSLSNVLLDNDGATCSVD